MNKNILNNYKYKNYKNKLLVNDTDILNKNSFQFLVKLKMN